MFSNGHGIAFVLCIICFLSVHASIPVIIDTDIGSAMDDT